MKKRKERKERKVKKKGNENVLERLKWLIEVKMETGSSETL